MTTIREKPVNRTQSRLIRRLIDPAEALRLLDRSVNWPRGASPANLSVARVFPSKGGGVGVQWDVRLEGTRQPENAFGSIYAVSQASPPQVPGNTLRLAKSGPFPFLGLSCRLEGTDVVLNTPDRDESLSGITKASAGPCMKDRLTHGIVGRILGKTKAWDCDCLNYRPRRRCVLRYRRKGPPGGPFVVGKIYRNGHTNRSPQIIRLARSGITKMSGGVLSIPRVLAVWRDWNMVVLEGVVPPDKHNGHAVSPIQQAQAAGDVLATLHELSPGALPAFTPADEINATSRWVELGMLAGRVNARAKRIWVDLRSWRSCFRRSSCCLIHRDFYDSQLLPTRRGWALVDFDTAASGDREQDIGNFIGHLIWDAIRNGGADAVWPDAASAFLHAYIQRQHLRSRQRTAATLDGARLRFYLVSSLLRVGIIHDMRSGSGRPALQLHEIADACRQTSPKKLLRMLQDAARPGEWRCS